MGLLDDLERLINEPGSAVILKERIALANDKYSALEKENMELRLRYKLSKRRINVLNLITNNWPLRSKTSRNSPVVKKASLKKLKLISCYFYQNRKIK